MKKGSKYLHLALLATYSIFLCDWFSLYLSDRTIPSVDLPGHIEIIKELAVQLSYGRIFFFDVSNFSGWPAFSFYGPLPHTFAAVLTYPLAFFTDNPAELAVHLVLVLGSALLPWTLYFSCKPLAFSFLGEQGLEKKANALLTLLVITFSFIFFNTDGELIGVGGPAIFQTGLFAQIFGWHLLLLHIGFLYRYLESNKKEHLTLLGLLFALLIICHPLSASFCMIFSFFVIIFARKNWLKLAYTYLVSILITSFWLIPYLIYSKSYTVNYTQATDESFLTYLLHYPPISLFFALLEITKGVLPFLNIAYVFILLLLITCFTKKNLWSSKLWKISALSILTVSMLVSGSFIQEALPGGIHFARYQGYLMLLVIHLLIAVPFAFNLKSDFTFCNLCLAALVCLINTYLLPSEHYLRFEDHPPFEVLESQNKVLKYFNDEPKKGRVFFEYFINPRQFTFITPHYMPSKLFRETGFESQNGVFIQSSLAYHHMATAASLNKIPSYHEDLNLGNFYRPDSETAIELLSFFGTSHLVLSSKNIAMDLLPYVKNAISIKPYKILELKTDDRKINYSSKTLIGYLDLNKTLPFSKFQHYFFSNKTLGPKFDLIELSLDKPIPGELSLVLINSNDSNITFLNEEFQERKKLLFNWHGAFQANHYNPAARNEKKNAAELRYFLNGKLKLPKKLLHFRKQRVKIIKNSPTVEFDNLSQELKLDNLLANKLVRVNYSYSPFWSSSDGEIYRGLGERIFFLPKRDSATLKYSAQTDKMHILGLLLSILSTVLLIKIYKE